MVRLAGALWMVLAVLWGGVLLGMWLWAMIAVVVPRTIDGAGAAILTSIPYHCCLILAVYFGGLGLFLGAVLLLEARQLDKLELAIDDSGISILGRRRVRVPWNRVRGAAVTSGKDGARLLVDAGLTPASWWSWQRIGPRRAQLLLLRGRRGPVLNVPLDALAADPAEVIRVLRAYTEVRLP